MEIIRLEGYSEREKAEIARRYLWPRRLKEAGIEQNQAGLPIEVLNLVIARYTREAGVRQLEQMLGKLTRKVALAFAELPEELERIPITIEAGKLDEWLGSERFMPEQARKNLPPGIATGLAWTPTGGDVLYIETTLLPGSHDLTLTGQLGDVMQESARAARSYLWSHAESMGLDISRFKRNGVHIHVRARGGYATGPHATGIKGIRGLAGAPLDRILAVLRDDTHRYDAVLKQRDLRDLARFVSLGQIDMEGAIDRATRRARGDAARAADHYRTICASCHGRDGTAIITTVALGRLASESPWGALHKILNGHPGAPRPALRVLGNERLVDILAYLQTLPQDR